MVVLTHASEPVGHQYPGKGATTPEVLMTFIQQHPDVTIVCAHWGGGLPFYALIPEVGLGLKRTYFDTSVSPFLYNQQIFSLASQVIGVDTILMGSDYPLLKPQRVIDQVNASSLTDDQKAAVLGGNAQRLLGLS